MLLLIPVCTVFHRNVKGENFSKRSKKIFHSSSLLNVDICSFESDSYTVEDANAEIDDIKCEDSFGQRSIDQHNSISFPQTGGNFLFCFSCRASRQGECDKARLI